MKKLIILLPLVTLAAFAQKTAVDHYTLDLKKSKLYWQDPGKHHEGFILFQQGHLTGSQNNMPTHGTFVLDMLSMQSTDGKTAQDRKKTDERLRSPEYFEVAKYPYAKVIIRNISAEKSNYKVTGELTIKGQTAPVQFTALLKKQGAHLTATATLSISRRRFNISKAKNRIDVLTAIHDSLSDDLIPVKLELYFVKK